MDTIDNSNPDYTEVRRNGLTFLHLKDGSGKILQVPSGGVGDDDAGGTGEDGAGAAGDAGGTGADDEGSRDGEQNAGADDEDEGAGGRAADDKGEKTTAGLQKRIKALAASKREYKELGTPESLRAMKARLAEYDRYEAELDREEAAKADAAARKAGEPTVAEQNAALDRMLTNRFGEGAPEDFQSFRETRRMEVQRHTKEGLDHLRKMLREHNLPDDDKTVAAYEKHIGTELLTDDPLRARFKDPVTQSAALTDAFKRVRADLVDPALVAVGASKLEAARKRRAAAPSSAGQASSPRYVEKELKPPKNATPEERKKFWDDAVTDAIREQDEYDALGA